jgi:hypothetical protein
MWYGPAAVSRGSPGCARAKTAHNQPPLPAHQHTARSTWLLKTVAGSGRPCLFVGDSGTAKSVTVAAFLAGISQATHTSRALGFSSRTSSMDVQRAIEDCVEKRTKVWGWACHCSF